MQTHFAVIYHFTLRYYEKHKSVGQNLRETPWGRLFETVFVPKSIQEALTQPHDT